MSPTHSDDHGPSLTLARNGIGAVTMCPCGVVTLSLQYLSLRFEADAFRELQRLLGGAQRRIDGEAQAHAAAAPLDDAAALH